MHQFADEHKFFVGHIAPQLLNVLYYNQWSDEIFWQCEILDLGVETLQMPSQFSCFYSNSNGGKRKNDVMVLIVLMKSIVAVLIF